MRKIALLLKPDKEIDHQGNHMTVRTLSTFRNYTVQFDVGVEFEEDLGSVDGRKCQVRFPWLGGGQKEASQETPNNMGQNKVTFPSQSEGRRGMVTTAGNAVPRIPVSRTNRSWCSPSLSHFFPALSSHQPKGQRTGKPRPKSKHLPTL